MEKKLMRSLYILIFFISSLAHGGVSESLTPLCEDIVEDSVSIMSQTSFTVVQKEFRAKYFARLIDLLSDKFNAADLSEKLEDVSDTSRSGGHSVLNNINIQLSDSDLELIAHTTFQEIFNDRTGSIKSVINELEVYSNLFEDIDFYRTILNTVQASAINNSGSTTDSNNLASNRILNSTRKIKQFYDFFIENKWYGQIGMLFSKYRLLRRAGITSDILIQRSLQTMNLFVKVIVTYAILVIGQNELILPDLERSVNKFEYNMKQSNEDLIEQIKAKIPTVKDQEKLANLKEILSRREAAGTPDFDEKILIFWDSI